jgi:hypothetical protein
MSYWTLPSSMGIPEVTLCDAHALEATNIALAMFGAQPYQSMAEAALDLETNAAVFGGFQFGFIETDEGDCEPGCEYSKATA